MSSWGEIALKNNLANPDRPADPDGLIEVYDANVAFADDAPAAVAPRQTTEHGEQVALFAWADVARKEHPELAMLFAVPNGGHRHPAVAAMLKAEGVRAGVPDVLLLVARGRFHGLAIEMKVKPNRPTAEQLEWLERFRHYGYSAVVCYSARDAIGVIMAYLTQEGDR